jgi:hypothetical protein
MSLPGAPSVPGGKTVELLLQVFNGLQVTLEFALVRGTFSFEGSRPTPVLAILVAMLPTVIEQLLPFSPLPSFHGSQLWSFMETVRVAVYWPGRSPGMPARAGRV